MYIYVQKNVLAWFQVINVSVADEFASSCSTWWFPVGCISEKKERLQILWKVQWLKLFFLHPNILSHLQRTCTFGIQFDVAIQEGTERILWSTRPLNLPYLSKHTSNTFNLSPKWMTTHPKVRQGHYCQLSQWYSTATSLCEKCPSATVLFQAPQTWSTLWTCCSFPTAKTNLRTAIDALIFWSVGFQGLNYRLLKRVRTLHTRLRSICGTSAALRVRAGSLQGIYIHCELDGICCCLRAQVVETCFQTKFPSVEVHGWQLRSAGVHHVDIPRS